MKAIGVLTFFAMSAYGAGCLPVVGDRIYARDLAAADPAFASLPASRAVGFAPSPGAKRVFTASELGKIARANGMTSAAVREACFEIPMRPISKEDLSASMRRALPTDVDLTLIEVPQGDFPAGSFEFPLTTLEPAVPGAGAVRMWRGSIRYGDTLRARIWARVDVRRPFSAVVAATYIPRNAAVTASQLRLATVSIALGQERGLARGIEEVIGSIAKSDVPAGTPLSVAALEKPLAVRRGDPVLVEVQSGRARIRMDALAEISARTGEELDLRNTSTGKVFHARLEGAGKAVIVVHDRQRP
jgi:flagella basal body P-ring formation protein FlgA